MQFSYFNTLALPWQAHLICECGIRLTERIQGEALIELYQIDSFYVEVHYRECDNEILRITGFQDTDYLEPYFDKDTILNISPLIVKNEGQ